MQRIIELGTLGRMQPSARFDVLVIGSGASGLAAAVAAERAGASVALATKGSIQANNSSKAQGGIQASFGADDSPELHAEDVMRSSHETADPRLVEVLDGRRAGGDPLARGARLRLHARERRLPPRPLRRRLAQAAAPGRRPHRPRDHEGAPRRARGGRRHELPEPRARRARADRGRLAGVVRRSRTASPPRSTPARSCSPPAAAATPRPRAATSSPRTIRTPPAR